ncbi:MAG: maleylpyruvate isomerase N-terminal domain-containing protein [Actinobacteria bacterium]|nr:maleylpyruvate isomerase N-terminal domain-containing protein [Actinomycetota bacterium]
MTTVTAPTIEPLDHAEAMELQAQELDQTIIMLRSLDDNDWTAQTDCPEWDVRQMYLHVLGASEAGASMLENVSQMRAAFSHRKKSGGPLEAALSSVQIQWMHRVDTARATGRPIELSPNHDGRIVADVVAEWARRHDRPFTLELEGPAGGTFAQDPDSPEAEHITLDAIEFCRILAGRDEANATGLMATVVPF